jgi:hypothetical protein
MFISKKRDNAVIKELFHNSLQPADPGRHPAKKGGVVITPHPFITAIL